MSGPARQGVIIYAKEMQALAEFYQAVFDMQRLRQTNDFISLVKDGLHVIIHVPPSMVDTADADTAFGGMKLFLTVDDMAQSQQQILALGGLVFPGQWQNALFKVSNVTDPNGNHIQLRQFFD